MGRNNPKYKRTIDQQMIDRLKIMLKNGIGTSKREAVKDGTAHEKIFSYSTYHAYKKHCLVFSRWLKDHHPEVTTLKKASRYVNDWLMEREGQGLSAYTMHLEAAAAAKLFGISPDDPKRYVPPARRRADIKRSRGVAKRDRHFSKTNNDELIRFCCATGCRRQILERLTGDDLWTRDRLQATLRDFRRKRFDPDYDEKLVKLIKETLRLFPDEFQTFIFHRRDKGGKSRFAAVVGSPEDVQLVVDRMRDRGPDELVWQHVHSAADIHGYRSVYATRLYRQLARDLDSIPYDRINKGSGKRYQSDVYITRGDQNFRYDRRALILTSKCLSHNRESVVVDNYLRNL